MFILEAVDENYIRTTLCYSEDHEKLEAMVAEFDKQTLQEDCSLLSFKNCPKIVTFGRFTLVKGKVGTKVDKFSCEEFSIYHLDALYVRQIVSA